MELLVITREFPPHVLGGISYHLKYLYEKLASRGHEITVVAGKCTTADPDGDVTVNADIDIQWATYASQTGNHLQFPIAAKKALRNIDTSTFDVALTHTPVPFSIGIPTIAKYHDCVQEEREFMQNDFNKIEEFFDVVINPSRRWVEQRSLTYADHYIFNSELTRRMWEKNYTLSSESSVIYNGVDLSVFYPRENSKTNERYLLFVGGEERKGMSKVASLAQELEYPIYVAGESTIDQKNMKGLGKISQPELAEYYTNAFATVHPAKFEAFGNVILESLACGTPVIVSKKCGASEIVDNSCGVISTDIKSSLARIAEIKQDACVSKAEQYSWKKVAARTEEVISQVMTGSIQ
ncbi:glycosyltransferase family 4 protein [Halarchaeum sp. P4]|uniref:glycosyltransferase family 4 protein n=1 Tax=Halarchaeum sp. P4 TaxID=3421639 RepID=UPI003EBA1BF8